MQRPVQVSVVIPTYRRERQLELAVRSVIDQELPSYEVIVIDDSPEASAREPMAPYVADHPVHYEVMPVPSGGRPALVRNHAIQLSRGRYLYFLDDDDTVVPRGLGHLVAALETRPRAGVAFGKVLCVGPDAEIRAGYNRWFEWAGRTAGRVRFSGWLTAGIIMFRGTVIINSCCMIRRSAALALGGYDPDLAVYEDVEFFTRGIRQLGHVFVDEPVLQYTTGTASIIHDLGGVTSPINEAYQRMHDKYRERHGMIDYRALQVLSKLLPVGHPEALLHPPAGAAPDRGA